MSILRITSISFKLQTTKKPEIGERRFSSLLDKLHKGSAIVHIQSKTKTPRRGVFVREIIIFIFQRVPSEASVLLATFFQTGLFRSIRYPDQ